MAKQNEQMSIETLTGNPKASQEYENIRNKIVANNLLGYKEGTKAYQNIQMAKDSLAEQGITDLTVTPLEMANYKNAVEQQLVPDNTDIMTYLDKQKLPEPTIGSSNTGRTFDQTTGAIYDASGKQIQGISGGQQNKYAGSQNGMSIAGGVKIAGGPAMEEKYLYIDQDGKYRDQTGKHIKSMEEVTDLVTTKGYKDYGKNKPDIVTDDGTPKFYRVGKDIFEAGTGRYIGPTEWDLDWSGKATEISAPTTPTTETKKSETTNTPTPTNATKNDIVNDFITRGKELGWPQELIDLGVLAIDKYPEGQEFDQQELINTFNKIKSETIDPYFQELADVAVADIKMAYSQLEESRTRELEQQNTLAGQEIRQAKANQEKAGMTFTGKGIEKLGAQSAYAQTGEVPTPLQETYGGLFYEGLIPQSQRLISSGTAATYQKSLQNLGRTAEGYLGTQKANMLGIPYSPAGVGQTGQLASDKMGKYGATMQQLIDQQRAKNNLTTTNLENKE